MRDFICGAITTGCIFYAFSVSPLEISVSAPVEPENPTNIGGFEQEKQSTFDDFLRAMRIVESNDNPNAIGDNGNAIGAYQIWESYWQDAVEFDPSIGGSYQDCYNINYAERVVRAYMDRYATPERIGRVATFEDMARMHNGGCNIFKKKGTNAWNNTTKYWNKIKRVMNQ